MPQRRRFRSSILAIATVLVGTATTAHAQAPATLTATLTAFADSLERTGFSGTVVVADTQRTLFARTMGYADAGRTRRITLADRWRWASVSKQITATLILRELDAGRIVLDTPVVRYLPAFLGVGRERITVRHLLQHTSGLPNLENGPKDPDGMPQVYRARTLTMGDGAWSSACSGTLVSTPGERFDYNNCDYLVLGALLARVTGRSAAQHAAALLSGSVTSRETVRGFVARDSLEPPFELAAYGSSGAFTGTAETLVRFDRLLLGSVLSPATRSEMWRGAPKFGFAALGAWSYDATLKGCPAAVPLVERRGEIQGVQVRNVLLPARGRIVVLFTNRGDFPFGEVWQGSGVMHDVLARAACG